MIVTSPEQNGQGRPCPFKTNSLLEGLLHFRQMGDYAFGMLCGHICVTGLAMGNAFLEMRDSFSQMRILHITS
jgi:hypothetical protein